MKIHDVGQGSVEWLNLRIGIPTASNFGSIITPTGKASAQADDYQNEILAEWLVGHPVESFSTKWTERGQDIEQQAVQFYEFQNEIEVKEVGLVTDDDFTMGCSPDRLVGEDGLLEIKSLKASNHLGVLLSQTPDSKHTPQIQGQLYITQRKWCDVLYFHPELPSLIVRVERDEAYIDILATLLKKFSEGLNIKRAVLREKGYVEREF